jgi:hypothetical protein
MDRHPRRRLSKLDNKLTGSFFEMIKESNSISSDLVSGVVRDKMITYGLLLKTELSINEPGKNRITRYKNNNSDQSLSDNNTRYIFEDDENTMDGVPMAGDSTCLTRQQNI